MLWFIEQETCPDLFRKQDANGRNNLLHKCTLLFVDYSRIYTNLQEGQHLSALYTPIDEENTMRVESSDSTSTHPLSFLGRNDTSSKIPVTFIDGGVALTDPVIQKIAGRLRTAQLKVQARVDGAAATVMFQGMGRQGNLVLVLV